MTYWPKTQIYSANTGSVDAFARWRVSTPRTLFDTVNRYNNGLLFWNTALTGGGSSTHLPDEASVDLGVGGTLGDKVIRQTYEYFRYDPGKSQLIVMTGTFGSPKVGVRKRLGYFDTQNGVFFEQTGAGMAVVLRSSTSGVPSDALRYTQNQWNVDPLDGTGPSKFNLAPENSNIFWFDIEWLGVGRVRFGVYGSDGFPIVCHEEQNANVRPTVYMSTAALPMRYEIENTAGGNADTFKAICCTVQSEGGGELSKPYYFGAASTAAIAVTTRRAVISIRPRATFGGVINRIRVAPDNIGLLVTTNDSHWELVYNPTYTNAPTWTDADTTNSSVEYSVHAGNTGVITGGVVVATGYAPSSQGQFSVFESPLFDFKYPITLDMNGANPRALALVCTSLNNTSNVRSAMNWAEIH